jgi:hypothetical protein
MSANQFLLMCRIIPTGRVLPVIQRKHNQNLAQDKGFPESPKPSKKAASLFATL